MRQILSLFRTLHCKLSGSLFSFLKDLRRFLIPQFCEICADSDLVSERIGLCKSCLKTRVRIARLARDQSKKRCSVCRAVLGEECTYCESRNVFFAGLFSLWNKTTVERYLMNRLKFDKIRSLSSYFSLGLGQILPELKRLDLDGIIPVPSHKNSEKERPFLPTEILVRRLEKKLGIPILPLVQKCSKTRQSSLNRESRIFHAQKAFQFVPNSGFSPCGNYLLVDDVFTTGASVNEIARILLEAGAGKVFVLVSTRPEEGLNI